VEEVYLHVFLSLVSGEGQWLASCSGYFTSWERISDTQWIGGWMSPRASLNVVMLRKKSQPLPEIEKSGE